MENLNAFDRLSQEGFSLIEALLMVASIAIIAAIALPQWGEVRESASRLKLTRDVDAINAAIDAYRANGGDLSGLQNPQAIIDRLKTVRNAASAVRFVGMTGSMLDPRLAADMTDSQEEGAPRAVWNPAESRFEIAGEGTGVRAFRLDEKLAEVDYGEEERKKSSFDYNAESGWIWSYRERTPAPKAAVPTITTVRVAETPGPASTAAPSMLLPPVFTPGDGIYRAAQFPVSVTLANPNDSSTWLMVSINGAGYAVYSGPLTLSADSVVTAFAAGDPARWINSAPALARYRLASPDPLLPPTIRLSAPGFDDSTPTISVSLSDNNPAGRSTLYFAVAETGGPLPPRAGWTAYPGTISVSSISYPAGFTIAAYAKAIAPLEYSDSPEASQTAGASFFFETPPAGSEVLYIIDVSSSMNESVSGTTRIALVLAALSDAIARLPPSVKFTVATFSGDVGWTVPGMELVSANDANKQAMMTQVAQFSAKGSGTNYEAALRIPFLYASRPTVVYFLTDGQPTKGGDFMDEVDLLASQNISVNTIGVDLSTESEAVLLEIASKTKGKTQVAKTK